MSMLQIAGRDLALNRYGFLDRFDDWDEEIAGQLAREEGLALTDCHWKVIRFLRDYYGANGIPPSPRVVIKSIGSEVSAHVPCTRRHLDRLFPGGGCKQACRLAGLPRHYCASC